MLMENFFSSGASHYHILLISATILLVVWSANGSGSALSSYASSKVNLLNDIPIGFCDHNCIIPWTNRVSCAINKEILDLLNEESISEVRSGRSSL